jgi:hypothetical protein
MVATIVLTQNNIAPAAVNNGNNQFVYNFPNSISFPNHEISVQNISMYYAWANINSTSLHNNTFYYTWGVAGQAPPYSQQFAVVIPDGLYEISTINHFLQFTMIQNGHYLIDTATGNYVYFIEMVVSPSNYTVQINTFPVPVIAGPPATAPTGYTLPTSPTAWSYYGASFVPTVSMANPNIVANVVGATHPFTDFYKIIGFDSTTTTNAVTAGDYRIVAGGVTASTNSVIAPQVQPNPTLFLAISNIDNKYSNPSTIVYQLSADVAFGQLINITPPQFAYNKLIPGTYNGLRLQILGTNFQPIQILDPAITITLVIRDRKDITLGDALNQASGGK